MITSPVIRTKIIPPTKSPRTLDRPRVTKTLSESLYYRLTLLQARAGYGKSTALSVLAETHEPLIWYRITEEDNDPLVFLLHLCHATQRVLSGLNNLPITYLESWDGLRGPLPSKTVLDQYLNVLSDGLLDPTILVLDDIHLAEASEIAQLLDRLVYLAPAKLHILLASRLPIKLPNLSRLKARGDVYSIGQSVLAFTTDEIISLFSNHYGYELSASEAINIYTATEGWAIALQLIWQSLRSGASVSVSDALVHQITSLEGLFDILTKEVFEIQPKDVQEFLLISATLREMTPASCDTLRGTNDSVAMLSYLQRQDLFVVDQRENEDAVDRHIRLRYHHIFHNFLLEQAAPEDRHKWDMLAAKYFQYSQNYDEVIFHLIRAREMEEAASLLEGYGAGLLSIGRLDTLATYLDSLPPEVLSQHPILLTQLGDLARLHSRFDEALGWYQQAEELWRERGQREGVARSLRGQARVFLDTLNPDRAEKLLQQSIRLTDGIEGRETQARLFDLMAENKLNTGQVEEAERLHQKANSLRHEGPSESQLLYRVLIRTGRLDEARRRLEARAEAERHHPVQTPRAHRETLLLLSLLYAFQGLSEEAYQNALDGTKRGIELMAPYITAVGHMRQGHALMLLTVNSDSFFSNSESLTERYIQARQQFEKTIELSQTLAVPRLRVEASWGLCRAYGYQGELAQALKFAQEGIEIALQYGDEWVASLVRLAMGASLTLAGRYEVAESWLKQASIGFQECSDTFGLCATNLWLCLVWFQQNKLGHLEQNFPEVLAKCQEYNYDYLLTRPTLLGFPDERMLLPLLIYAHAQTWETSYINRLLREIGLPNIKIHPGYQLRVATLGTFQTWRGSYAIHPKGWRREKSRQLFQILLTYRESPLDRDQIIEYLWPEMAVTSASKNFKVTLNTLNQVLEPDRKAGEEPAFILREGSTYALRPGADLSLDAQIFSSSIHRAENIIDTNLDQAIILLEKALNLYQGEYLPDARYETWAAAERENLAVLFLRSADNLANIYIHEKRFEDSIDLCQRILSHDNCWERAYRHLMISFDYLGDHGQVARTYQRCVKTLDEELDVVPAAETNELFQQLTYKRGG